MSNPDSASTPDASHTSPRPHMCLAEAAAYLGISPRKLWSEAKARNVKAIRIGSRVIYPKAELDRYVALKLAAA